MDMGTTPFEAFYQRVANAAGIESQMELAALLGVSRSAITQAKKRNAVPEKWILKLARDFGYSPLWLEKGVGERFSVPQESAPQEQPVPGYEFLQVPKVVARLSAGGGSFEVESEVEEYYSFRQQWLRRKGRPDSMVIMDVSGTSMEPEIHDGDTALIDQSQKNILAGHIYAVGVEDTVMVKRLEKRPSALALISDNPDYSPIVLQGDEIDSVRIIGKVVWIGREYW